MNDILPKELFLQGHKAEAVALSEIVQQPALRYATVFALAEMARRGASKEQLDGARSVPVGKALIHFLGYSTPRMISIV